MVTNRAACQHDAGSFGASCSKPSPTNCPFISLHHLAACTLTYGSPPPHPTPFFFLFSRYNNVWPEFMINVECQTVQTADWAACLEMSAWSDKVHLVGLAGPVLLLLLLLACKQMAPYIFCCKYDCVGLFPTLKISDKASLIHTDNMDVYSVCCHAHECTVDGLRCCWGWMCFKYQGRCPHCIFLYYVGVNFFFVHLAATGPYLAPNLLLFTLTFSILYF